MFPKVKPKVPVVTLAIVTSCLVIYLLTMLLVREQGERHKLICASNLRQIGQAVGMYVADNDGYMPGKAQWSFGTIPSLPKSGCPGSETIPKLNPPLPDENHRLSGYAFNSNIGGKNAVIDGHFVATQLPYTALPHPQTTIVVFDYTSGIATTSVLDFYKMSGSSWPKRLTQGWKRHHGGGNYLFCDGHVTWLRESRILVTEPDICDGDKSLPNFCADGLVAN